MKNEQLARNNNIHLLKSSVNRHALFGLTISLVAVIVATLVNCYLVTGSLSLPGIYSVQKDLPILWLLDALPFIFLLWGQYVGSILAYEANTLINDQTDELRNQTASLEKRVMYEATHDSLTELPNRVLLHDRLDRALTTAVRYNYLVGVIILDLDRFKEVNDTLGHFAGDKLLKQVALRLTGVVRKSDTLARMGGDEFAILLTHVKDTQDLDLFINRILKVMVLPFKISGMSLDLQASMGIALCPDHGKDVDTLIQRAEVAMYAAKQQKNGYAVYSKNLDRFSPKRLTLMGELRQALQRDELVLYYQPQIDLKTRTVKQAEALIRWEHPVHGLLPPNEFIKLAERTGLIKDLTNWVLDESISQILKWEQQDFPMTLAVNISPSCLLNTDLPEIIIGSLGSHNLGRSMLTIEITETSIIQDPELASEVLNRLKKLGADISIDDFGTGYSSLALLKKLPVSEMKIDKSFVMDMLNNDDDETIVKSIIDLAHNLGLSVVAEGVESLVIAQRLQQLNCDTLQGYYFSKPLPAKEFKAWHASHAEILMSELLT
ncbi:MAG: GGDEF-domain containing protein [Desulfobulbus sp.]|nr:MAG: GGDEF-domain containing protein [Desulfobulbus sp.]